ncbi:MAG TPA: hypothetical protein VGD89_01805 [Flavipsychrobacter sp.]
MKTIFRKIAAAIGAVYGVLCGLTALLLLVDFIIAPKEIVFIYNIGPNGDHWQFLSKTNHIIWLTMYVLFYAGFAILNFTFFKRYTKRLFIAVVILDLLIIALSIRFYWLEYTSGYDHYPGFDPYIL